MVFISVKDKLFKLTKKENYSKKDTNHYLFSFDFVEYNFKDIYKSFSISYLSKDNDLLSNFVDENDLKDYESIEKTEKDRIQILIKKFKLRITFAKRKKMSREIIICDDYEFDLNSLNHTNSLIKIAFIKNNPDEWLNCGNLNNYDFIFTLNEYYNMFKEKYGAFNIKSEKTYFIIKDMLNVLYKKRIDKFYHFVKNIEFINVLPKWNNYFNVLDSEYFDDIWYGKTYDISDNTDCATHYILIGFEKGNDPGPNFSNDEYYEVNPDVKKAGVNPLIHYETRGRKENRSISSEKFHSLISNSPYFDKEWYEENYDISNEYDDAATHYLKIGFKRGYNPGPDCDSNEYLEANPDVKNAGLNPLVHYEDSGREAGRPLSLNEYYSFISQSSYFDEQWYKENYDISDDDAAMHYLKIGFKKGYNPGPRFNTNEYLKANPDIKQRGMNPLVHYEKDGKNEGRHLSVAEYHLSVISNSPYFDKAWYGKTYDLSNEPESGATHYLKIGFKRGYNPGPDFDTNEYYELNPDVKKAGMNPLLHYEINGRRENRKIHSSDKEIEE